MPSLLVVWGRTFRDFQVLGCPDDMSTAMIPDYRKHDQDLWV